MIYSTHQNKRSVFPKKKTLDNEQNKQKSHKPSSGTRIQDDAPLAGNIAADLSVRYQYRLLQSVLQDSYLTAAHTHTPSRKGT